MEQNPPKSAPGTRTQASNKATPVALAPLLSTASGTEDLNIRAGEILTFEGLPMLLVRSGRIRRELQLMTSTGVTYFPLGEIGNHAFLNESAIFGPAAEPEECVRYVTMEPTVLTLVSRDMLPKDPYQLQHLLMYVFALLGARQRQSNRLYEGLLRRFPSQQSSDARINELTARVEAQDRKIAELEVIAHRAAKDAWHIIHEREEREMAGTYGLLGFLRDVLGIDITPDILREYTTYVERQLETLSQEDVASVVDDAMLQLEDSGRHTAPGYAPPMSSVSESGTRHVSPIAQVPPPPPPAPTNSRPGAVAMPPKKRPSDTQYSTVHASASRGRTAAFDATRIPTKRPPSGENT